MSDLAGRQVAPLLDGETAAGPGFARWSAEGTPGICLARLEGPGFQPRVRRIVVTR